MYIDVYKYMEYEYICMYVSIMVFWLEGIEGKTKPYWSLYSIIRIQINTPPPPPPPAPPLPRWSSTVMPLGQMTRVRVLEQRWCDKD